MPRNDNLEVDNLEVNLDVGSLQLWFKADDSLLHVGAQRGPGTEYDFFGHNRGNGTLLAGPFQSVKPHSQALLRLWPPPEWEALERRYKQLSVASRLQTYV